MHLGFDTVALVTCLEQQRKKNYRLMLHFERERFAVGVHIPIPGCNDRLVGGDGIVMNVTDHYQPFRDMWMAAFVTQNFRPSEAQVVHAQGRHLAVLRVEGVLVLAWALAEVAGEGRDPDKVPDYTKWCLVDMTMSRTRLMNAFLEMVGVGVAQCGVLEQSPVGEAN